jgi:NDP-sugar pyrophosphorylase family protein
MKAIIIAENSQCRLSPLTDRTPHALLPVAGKTILMHALETLHRSSILDVTVVSPSYCAELASGIDMGPLIGMDVRFIPIIPEREYVADHVLVIGLKDIVDTDWDDVLDELGDLKLHALIPIRMTVCAQPVALVLPPGHRARIPVDWGDVHLLDAIHLPIGPKRVMSTAKLRDYHQANFHLLRGEFKYLKPAGREYSLGHRASPKARVNAKSVQSNHGYFGSHCRIDKTARLGGDVIIGDRVVVGKGANVRDSIIFEKTYIGSHTDCSDAIVDGNLLIKVDTGVSLLLDDPVLFGAI